MKVDESNTSVCCSPIMEYVADASEPGGKGDQASMGESRHSNVKCVVDEHRIVFQHSNLSD